MAFKVIKSFADMTDNGHVYKDGDEYPRLGLQPTIERINELSGNNNKIGCALIVEKEENYSPPTKPNGRKGRRR